MNSRQPYVARQERQLREWRTALERLAQRVHEAGPGGAAGTCRQLDALRAGYEVCASQLDELRQASESKWEEIQPGVERAFTEMDERMKALARLR